MNLKLQPIITEKSINTYQKNRVATFEIGVEDTKKSVKHLVERLYPGVKVKQVNILTRLGKYRLNRNNNRIVRKSRHKKIAYVKIIEGSIDVFSKS